MLHIRESSFTVVQLKLCSDQQQKRWNCRPHKPTGLACPIPMRLQGFYPTLRRTHSSLCRSGNCCSRPSIYSPVSQCYLPALELDVVRKVAERALREQMKLATYKRARLVWNTCLSNQLDGMNRCGSGRNDHGDCEPGCHHSRYRYNLDTAVNPISKHTILL